MSGNSTVDREIAALKRKLEVAIESRSAIDDEFKLQSTLFTEFIIKLSQASKGTDLSLDNKLAKLRLLFTKSAPIADVQKLITEISLLLQKFSLKKEQEIAQLHSEFNLAGQALQKVNGLPDELRRQLRALLKDHEDTKDALAQYVPLMSQLVVFYQTALKKDNIATSTGGLLNQQKAPAIANTSATDQEIIKRFTDFLTKVNVSRQYQNQLLKIKSELNENMPNEKLLNSFLAAFDVISHDLVHERNTAKVFLSTLSETLSIIQSAVKSTISTQNKCNKKHQQLNTQLQGQITDMAKGLDAANSLVDIKVDISGKLKAIATTLNEKTLLENTLQVELERKLVDMQDKIEKLEEQSITFEKRIQEQQAKSLQDALTKLNNRAAFDEYFAKEIVRYQHNGGSLAIAIADLDNFKGINDTYGHTAGDKTLQVLASTFKKHLENDAFIARYGGEEFVFIFRGKDKDEVMQKLNLLKSNIAKLPFKFKNNKVSMTLSVGVTHIKSEDNVHIAFERADTALYKAKEEGKNRVIYSIS
jgi:diguanylate cyclase